MIQIKKRLNIILPVSLFILLIATIYVQGVSVLETDVAMPGVSTSSPQTLRYETEMITDTELLHTATTTFQTIGVDQVDLNIQFQGSTTDATLNWYYEFSDNFTDWYGEDISTASTISIAHSSTTTVHTWNPEITTLIRKNLSITDIASRYMRIVFSTSNATSSVYARVALKSVVSGQ